jgi:hypothetical protein
MLGHPPYEQLAVPGPHPGQQAMPRLQYPLPQGVGGPMSCPPVPSWPAAASAPSSPPEPAAPPVAASAGPRSPDSDSAQAKKKSGHAKKAARKSRRNPTMLFSRRLKASEPRAAEEGLHLGDQHARIQPRDVVRPRELEGQECERGAEEGHEEELREESAESRAAWQKMHVHVAHREVDRRVGGPRSPVGLIPDTHDPKHTRFCCRDERPIALYGLWCWRPIALRAIACYRPASLRTGGPMLITGKCHCGNIAFDLHWEGDPPEIPARACGCSFCVKHGGVWTSDPSSRLTVRIGNVALVSKYTFGTRTATFHVCSRCGAVPLVTCEIARRVHAVVNVNALENIDPSWLRRSAASFEGEDLESRILRRQRNWMASVRIADASA